MADSSDDAAEPTSEIRRKYDRIPPLPILGSAENSMTPSPGRNEPLLEEARARLATFLATYQMETMFLKIGLLNRSVPALAFFCRGCP